MSNIKRVNRKLKAVNKKLKGLFATDYNSLVKLEGGCYTAYEPHESTKNILKHFRLERRAVKTQ